MNRLSNCIAQGKVKTFKRILQQSNFDINYCDSDGHTLLNYAVHLEPRDAMVDAVAEHQRQPMSEICLPILVVILNNSKLQIDLKNCKQLSALDILLAPRIADCNMHDLCVLYDDLAYVNKISTYWQLHRQKMNLLIQHGVPIKDSILNAVLRCFFQGSPEKFDQQISTLMFETMYFYQLPALLYQYVQSGCVKDFDFLTNDCRCKAYQILTKLSQNDHNVDNRAVYALRKLMNEKISFMIFKRSKEVALLGSDVRSIIESFFYQPMMHNVQKYVLQKKLMNDVWQRSKIGLIKYQEVQNELQELINMSENKQ